MNRRSLHTALAAAVAIVVLLCAAASGPGTLWISPPGGNTPLTPSSEPIEDTVVERPAKQAERGGEWPAWVGGVLRAAAVLLLVALLISAGALATSGRLPRPRWWHFRAGAQGPINPLPEHDDPTIAIDVALARAALDGGTPRNGIVACWMQLEDDAAAAGLARLPSETPAEYVQRVVAASSVDPAPIGELAALYREARFSRHELGDAHRARALAALERVADGLPREAEVVA